MRSHTTFRQLEIFEAIARLGSFTRASEELYLTQPTVSMQMKKLTEAVGVPLIEQVGKKLHLTPTASTLPRPPARSSAPSTVSPCRSPSARV